MGSAALPVEAREAVVLAVHEAVANGVEHGTPGSPVSVTARTEEGGVTVEIRTAGPWAEPHPSSSDVDPGGRGLALMRSLTNGLEILVDEQFVTIRLRSPA